MREYKVPVVPFVSESVLEVTRAFQLVNSQGTPMSTLHMVNALAWTREFRLLDEIERCQEELTSIGWKGVDETVLLRCYAVAVGLSGYEYDPAEFAKKLVERSDHGGKRVVRGLKRVARILQERCGIDSPGLVPYSVQILVLFSALLGIKTVTDKHKELAAHWLWYTTYIEAFSGSTSSSMISRVTEDLKDALRGKEFNLSVPRGPDRARCGANAVACRSSRLASAALVPRNGRHSRVPGRLVRRAGTGPWKTTRPLEPRASLAQVWDAVDASEEARTGELVRIHAGRTTGHR